MKNPPTTTSAGFAIGGRPIGPGHATWVVAEMAANHGQDFAEALRILQAAKVAGADALCLDVYTADTLTLPGEGAELRPAAGGPWQGTPWEDWTLHQIYSACHTPWEWLPELAEIAAEVELKLVACPGDAAAVEFLQPLAIAAFRISPYEIVDLALVRRVAETGKPVLLATAMATRQEIEEAVATARQAGGERLALLAAGGLAPAPPEALHLRTLPDLARAFDLPVGFSDRTLDSTAAVAAVALGASIVEKHLTLSRARPVPESAFSLEPGEFKDMVEALRDAEKSLGEARDGASDEEEASRRLRRSLWWVEDLAAGEEVSERHVSSLRPAGGLEPRHLPAVLGRRAARDVSRGKPLTWDDLVG